MSEQRFPSFDRQDSEKRLIDDLMQLNAASESGITEDEEMLSLIIEDASQGIDISKRYPAFYEKLLNHPDLRQAFLDIVDSLEEEDQHIRIPWTEETDVDLGFLNEQSSAPLIARLQDHWTVSWQRTIDHLQALFSPSELAYRADPTLSEDLWFILLREEIKIEDLLYTIVLECTVSEENAEALSPSLNVAVTIGTVTDQSPFPIQASLQWGTYQEQLQIHEEGRVRFPDIPLKTIFDPEHKSIIAQLHLVLEPST